MVPSGRPAGEPPAGARARAWPAVIGLLVLAAGIRALRAWGVLAWPVDETLDAIPAIEILHGTLPLFHVSVEYAGASKAYPLAAWFAVAGTSTTALDLYGYMVGLAGVGTSILVAVRMLSPGAARFACLALAVPSLHSVTWAVGGNLLYPFTLLIGNILLLGTHAVFFRGPARAGPVLVVGLVAGIGWRTNPLVVAYWAPFFPPTTVRYVRIRPAASAPTWTIAEITPFE